MGKTVKKIWNIANGILIAAVAILAVALVGVRLFGLELYVVLSGSMEPTYQTGAVIYVKETDVSALQEGDVITYYLDDETVATHRIIEVTEENGETYFRTKGDANEMEDAAPVPAENVIGSPVFTIPELGRLVTFLHSESGRYATYAGGAMILLMIFLPDLIFGSEDKKQKEEKHEKENSADSN